MTRSRIAIIVAALAVGLGAGWASRHMTQVVANLHPQPANEELSLGLLENPQKLPAFAMRTIDNKPIAAETLRGKVLIVNFWATWCPPCRAEIPDLIALQDKYRDQLQIIGVSQDEGPVDAVRKFAAEHQMNYPIVMTTPEIEKVFAGIYALPTSFIIDRESRIVQKHVGMLNASTTELETRYLAGLETNVKVQYVEDEKKTLIKNAAQATKIPGIDLDKLTPAARAACLQRLNTENCTCGCMLTLAACRINDPTCSISLPLAQKIAASLETAPGATRQP
jgi:thiol-disulfide isomerase/thioredoxin